LRFLQSVRTGRGAVDAITVKNEYIDEAFADSLFVFYDQYADLLVHQVLRLPVHAFLMHDPM
jgi:hypothetical protein